ncbi:MAG: hypothetical protein JO270_18280 [Acidobacteriaceae bacterium]|nr:hypothetical protein [Acidobacteriaceae bacterium]
MAFSFQLNKQPANFVGSMMQLWQTMVQAGWLVLSWSDGTNVNGSPGPGFLGFTTASDGTPNSGGGAGSANNGLAWILLQQPAPISGAAPPPYGGTRQLVFQRDPYATYNWRIKYSQLGAYTNPSTPGNATTTPAPNSTLNDEYLLEGGGTDSSPTFSGMFYNNYEGTMHCHTMADDGKNPANPYGFWMVTIPNGLVTYVQGTMLFDPMMSGTAAPGDLDPFIFYSDNNSNEVIYQWGYNNGWHNDTYGNMYSPHGWLKKGQSNQSNQPFAALAPGNYNNNLLVAGRQSAYGQTNMSFGSNHISRLDDLWPIIYARRSSQSGLTGYKGFSSMVRGNANPRVTGDTLSIATPGVTRDRFVVNNCNFPWDGVTVPLV